MTTPWPLTTTGVVELPSGKRIRGRPLRHGMPAGPAPTLGAYLTSRPPTPQPWHSEWIPWRDFWVPKNIDEAVTTLLEIHRRAAIERVEIACGGGIGRTGTALAVLCVFDGLRTADAVDWVRRHYHRRAVEVPWQRRVIRRAERLSRDRQ